MKGRAPRRRIAAAGRDLFASRIEHTSRRAENVERVSPVFTTRLARLSFSQRTNTSSHVLFERNGTAGVRVSNVVSVHYRTGHHHVSCPIKARQQLGKRRKEARAKADLFLIFCVSSYCIF